ncbi:MAG TPA: bifunctional chorismate mutase/prephenate dehydrogenase [Bacteroidetes bacterium]|nr:bifunctional chorismate mutase/prephenate dehydrogenase [Bacteroidota bacterium]
MPKTNQSLNEFRVRIDSIDEQILDLLKERAEIVKGVLMTKIQNKLPIYVAGREDQKIQSFREMAIKRNMDPEWAEDFLRMIMSSSRASQSASEFPCATTHPKKILILGGSGGMGKQYATLFASSGHEVRILDKNDWDKALELFNGVDLVIVSVPINITVEVIKKAAQFMPHNVVLADFTSNKSEPLSAMLDVHAGPVIGLHPMHGPDVQNLSKQLMITCHGRDDAEYDWIINQFQLWGMRVLAVDPLQHDKVMNLVQGLRHFVALLHGSFMKTSELKPEDILHFSSPIYRAELMMTGRIFAQDAELYADIVFATEERRNMLLEFLGHHERLADMVRKGDKKAFIQEFESITDFFGEFAETALNESGYLINRLADRFS